jgi:hypothetical protein
MTKINYREGTVFAVPIAKESYAIGLVARCNPRNYAIFGYFFPKVFHKPPVIEELTDLSPEASVLMVRFGDYGLVKKLWPVIGQLDPWHRNQWPMPLFYRKDFLLEGGWIVEYADDDPTKFIRETRTSGNPDGLISDGDSGYAAVEDALSDLLINNLK